VRIYHQAFEVDNLHDSVAALETAGARLVSPPIPAVAFQGRKVCFLMMRNLMLVELIEAAHG
jgi:methylmalonyl-CoA/ethylmalonyl-CoA epimerase